MFGDSGSASAGLVPMAKAASMPEPSKEAKLARRRARGALDVSRGARILEGPAEGRPEDAAAGTADAEEVARTPADAAPAAEPAEGAAAASASAAAAPAATTPPATPSAATPSAATPSGPTPSGTTSSGTTPSRATRSGPTPLRRDPLRARPPLSAAPSGDDPL